MVGEIFFHLARFLGLILYLFFDNPSAGSTISTNRYMIESTLKIARYCPLVIQGFSNFLGLFQGIMANPVQIVRLRTSFREFPVMTPANGSFQSKKL